MRTHQVAIPSAKPGSHHLLNNFLHAHKVPLDAEHFHRTVRISEWSKVREREALNQSINHQTIRHRNSSIDYSLFIDAIASSTLTLRKEGMVKERE